VDVPRTAPDVGLFRSNRIRRILARLLYIWAMRHPASSYVQGINDLVTPLIAVFLSRYYGGKDVTDGIGIEDVPDETLFEVRKCIDWNSIKSLDVLRRILYLIIRLTSFSHTGRSRCLLVSHETPSRNSRSLYVRPAGSPTNGIQT